ncbi:MAG: retropepsin-like domain-containing protein [Bacilli bacterium]|nr:retropepsin-like domain-containing protein [Bacilli bacterium]
MNIKPIAFTVSAFNRLTVLTTPVNIYSTNKFNKDFKKKKDVYTALWDTGSSMTVISDSLATELGLAKAGEIDAETAGGKFKANKYIISLSLPNRLNIENVMVSSGKLGPGIDILIGMDIIGLGDFAISNVDNKTVFSFRFPSCNIIDFVKNENI